MFAFAVCRSRGFSVGRLSRRHFSQAARSLSEKDDSTEWDAIAGPPSAVQPQAGNRYESTDEDFGAYDFDPSQLDFPETDMSIFEHDDEAPPQSAWDNALPATSSAPKIFPVPATTRARAPRAVAVPRAAAPLPPPTIPEPSPPVSETPKDPEPAVIARLDLEAPSGRDDLYAKTSNGGGMDVTVERLEERLKELEQTIFTQNKGESFNVNSPKQVSMAVFGDPGQSTNKDALEAVGAAGNVLADLILKYRQQKQEIKRLVRKQQNVIDGTHVKSFSKTESVEGDNDPLILVDASAYIFRAYYSMPPIHRSDGMPTGAVMGFCNMLNRLVLTRSLEGDCPRLVLVFDAKGKNFRHELYEDYKANRADCPIDLVPQFDLIREAAKAYGIPEIEAQGYEADDVIATLATRAIQAGLDTHILSGDKDLMQLVTPPDMMPYVHMVDPMSMSRIDHNVVKEKWGVTPDLVGDILALAGDSADNIPGVPGIGPKIAANLLEDFGSLDGLLEQLENVKQKGRREKLIENQDLAILSRKLVELERCIPDDRMTSVPAVVNSVNNLRMEQLNGERLLDFYDSMGFRDLKRRVQDRLTQRERKAEAGISAPATSDAGTSAPATPMPTPKPPPKRKKAWKQRAKAHVPRPEDYEDVPF